MKRHSPSFVPRAINSETRPREAIGEGSTLWQSRESHVTIVRVGMRSFGVVRSEAELNELAYELHEKEEVHIIVIHLSPYIMTVVLRS